MLLMYEKVFIIIVIVFFVFVCMINIFFYILIVYNIYFMLNVENKIGNRMYFSVYIKLFFIIGLFWLLQIIDMFLEILMFIYVVVILNGL